MILFANRLSAVVPLGHRVPAAVFGSVRLEPSLGGPQIPVSPCDQKRPAGTPAQAIAKGTAATLSRLNGERPRQGKP